MFHLWDSPRSWGEWNTELSTLLSNIDPWPLTRSMCTWAYWHPYSPWPWLDSINRTMWFVPLATTFLSILLDERKRHQWRSKNQSNIILGCLMKVKYSYGVAAESSPSSPCSNVPIACPLCSSAAPAIWKYFMKAHFQETHKSAPISNMNIFGSFQTLRQLK